METVRGRRGRDKPRIIQGRVISKVCVVRACSFVLRRKIAFRGQTVTDPLRCETQKKMFSEFTAPNELVQIRTSAVRPGLE